MTRAALGLRRVDSLALTAEHAAVKFVTVLFTTLCCLAGSAEAEDKPVLLDAVSLNGPTLKTERTLKDGAPWGFRPYVELYVHFAGVEDDDVLLLQHKKGNKKWGKPQKCKVHYVWKNSGLARFICRAAEDISSNRAGAYSVSVSYKQTAAGNTFKDLDTYRYKVLKYNCDNRHVKRRWKPGQCFVIDYDHHLGEAWLRESHKDLNTPVKAVFTLWFKWKGSRPQEPKMRCYLDGKKVADFAYVENVRTEEYRPYKKANELNIKAMGWSKLDFSGKNLAFRREAKPIDTTSWPDHYYIEEHPGDYKCTITHDSEMVRELFFTVGKDGKLVRPECATSGKSLAVPTLNTPVKMVHKGGGAKFDRTAHKKGGYYGKGACTF
jgi:hypothetical protein